MSNNDESIALAAYVAGSRSVDDFLDIIKDASPAAIDVLRKMLGTPNPKHDADTIAINASLLKLLPPVEPVAESLARIAVERKARHDWELGRVGVDLSTIDGDRAAIHRLVPEEQFDAAMRAWRGMSADVKHQVYGAMEDAAILDKFFGVENDDSDAA